MSHIAAMKNKLFIQKIIDHGLTNELIYWNVDFFQGDQNFFLIFFF